MDWNEYDAALFDLDGVITPTAEVHMRAWSRMFNEFLTARGVDAEYTDVDYHRYVDGKPRYDAAAVRLVEETARASAAPSRCSMIA